MQAIVGEWKRFAMRFQVNSQLGWLNSIIV
jgi:hypothetical protein